MSLVCDAGVKVHAILLFESVEHKLGYGFAGGCKERVELRSFIAR